MSVPWQLYVFSAVNIIGSFFMYGWVYDPCLLLTGQEECKPGSETFVVRAMAVGFLYIGVFFGVLTYRNKDTAPKLKRLANMGLNCAVSLLVGVIFTGPRKFGGAERDLFHFLDMIGGFVLLLIMVSAVANSSEMADHTSPLTGLGVNPKSFVLLITIVMVVKFFVISDFKDPSSFLNDSDGVTKLSYDLWGWLSTMLLEILFPTVFALVYGDDTDQETITWATIVMMIVSLVSYFPIKDSFEGGRLTLGYITFAVFEALALLAVFFGRRSKRHEYDAVPIVSTDV